MFKTILTLAVVVVIIVGIIFFAKQQVAAPTVGEMTATSSLVISGEFGGVETD